MFFDQPQVVLQTTPRHFSTETIQSSSTSDWCNLYRFGFEISTCHANVRFTAFYFRYGNTFILDTNLRICLIFLFKLVFATRTFVIKKRPCILLENCPFLLNSERKNKITNLYPTRITVSSAFLVFVCLSCSVLSFTTPSASYHSFILIFKIFNSFLCRNTPSPVTITMPLAARNASNALWAGIQSTVIITFTPSLDWTASLPPISINNNNRHTPHPEKFHLLLPFAL